MSDSKAFVGWFNYDLNARRAVSECEFEMLYDDPLFVSFVVVPTKFNHDIPHFGREGDSESDWDSRRDLTNSESIVHVKSEIGGNIKATIPSA